RWRRSRRSSACCARARRRSAPRCARRPTRSAISSSAPAATPSSSRKASPRRARAGPRWASRGDRAEVAMSGPDFELATLELPFAVASMDPADPDPEQMSRDGGVLIMPAAGVDTPPTYVPQSVLDADAKLASALLTLVPYIGNAKSLIEGFRGEDLITGEHLAWWERSLDIVFAVPVDEPGEEAPQIAKTIYKMYDVSSKMYLAYEGYQAVHAGYDVHEAGEQAEKTYGHGELQPPDLTGGH